MRIKNLLLTDNYSLKNRQTLLTKFLIAVALVFLWGCFIFKDSFNEIQITASDLSLVEKNAINSAQYASSVAKKVELKNIDTVKVTNGLTYKYSRMLKDTLLKRINKNNLSKYFGESFYKKYFDSESIYKSKITNIKTSGAFSKMKSDQLTLILISQFKENGKARTLYIEVLYDVSHDDGKVINYKFLSE